MMQEISDKAGSAYWTKVWEHSGLSPAIDLGSKDLHLYPQRALHKIFKQAFKGRDMRGMKLIEIGCGNSAWLPYFAKEYGFDVYGIDYSEKGCKQAEQILKRDNTEGTVYCADAFHPAGDLFSEYDVVCSFGVVEHFNDTAGTLAAFSKYLKKGGLLITTVPNMCGANGWLHKMLNRPLYDIHIPIGKSQMIDTVESAGLKCVVADYYIGMSLNVQLNGIHPSSRFYRLKRIISKAGAFISLVFWWMEERMGTFPQTKLFSRGVFSIAEKQT